MSRLPVIALLVFAAASLAAARDIYVNNVAGDDFLEGERPMPHPAGGPVRTIGRALELVLPGDRIVLANTGEPYREAVCLSDTLHHGDPLRPLVIDGAGATLDGSRPIATESWQHVSGDVFRCRPYRPTYQQLFLSGKPLRRKPVATGSENRPELDPLEWCLHEGLIYFRVEKDRLPADYDLACAYHPAGITLYHVHDVLIRNLVVQGYQLDGINAHDGARRCRAEGVTLRGNGRSGLAVAGCSHFDLVGSLVGDNGAAQVYVEALGHARIEQSSLLDNTAPPVVQKGGRVVTAEAP